MATTYSSNTFATTYKDDYRDSDNYYRILFNSGRALQARELTQLQTIIQAEIGRFARNIFNEGAVVNPGGITVNNRLSFIKLDESVRALADNLPTVGEEWYTTPGNAIKFKVLRVEEADAVTGDPATLYVSYTSTKDATAGATTIVVPGGSQITNGTGTLDVQATNATGYGTLASVAKGEYFTKDHFVFAAEQSFLLSKYTGNPIADIGFKITEDIVTVADTDALYDNQGAVANAAAPGADRYRIRLTLTSRDLVDSAENFVFVARVVNGVVSLKAEGASDYNKINDVLALRTKEESGDYAVKIFNAKLQDLNDSNLRLTVSPGVAYVEGYRLETSLTTIDVPKAQDTGTVNDKNVIARFGNYVLQDSDGANNGLPNINNFATVNLRDTASYGGSTIGTARVRSVERNRSDIRYYLFDIKMNAGQSFASSKSFGTSASDYVNIKLSDGIASLQETSNNNLLFPLSNIRPTETGVTVDALTVQRRYSFTTNGSGNASVPPGNYPVGGGSSVTFTDPGDWLLTSLDSSISAGDAAATIALDSANADISGLSPSTQYELLALVTVDTPTHKSKTLRTRNINATWPGDAESDGAGLTWINLDRADIYDITRVTSIDSNGSDILSNFVFDNGQRDNFYARGRLIKKANISIPSGNVSIGFRFFEHGAGHFFSVNSYSAINYTDIPSHRKNNGEIVSLRDVLDFRSSHDSTGDFQDDDDIRILLPENSNAIGVDATYYLPRKDKLVVKRVESDVKNNRAEVAYIKGVSDFNPLPPPIPPGSMLLYNYTLNPYTLNDSDFQVEFINNKSYTMRDIGKIEKRIDKLEELTTLSLLEANTASLLVLDSAGNPRTKSGFLADNFNTGNFSDPSNAYRASIDQADNTLNPPFIRDNIRLVYDSDNTNNTVQRSGDLITLPYTHSVVIDQNLASETMNINPFAVITSTGFMVMSPSSDEWVETQYKPDEVIQGEIQSNVNADRLRQALQNGWTGASGTDVITSDRTVREQVGDVIVEVQVIPWMRSRNVAFRVVGLRPNTKYFPFFNNVDVSDWCNDDSFTRVAFNTTTYGNRYSNATAHPFGTDELISNDEGTVEGSFFIPSTDTLKFKTGSSTFKLLDVSTGDENDAVSFALGTFTSAGVLQTRQKTIRSTRHVQVERVPPPPAVNIFGDGPGPSDPLAQTFFVDRVEYPNGMFLTKVEVYFSSKDSIIPVICQIVTVENGIPTTTVLPDAVATLSPSDVTIDVSNDMATLRTNGTQFTFEEPVYLLPGREYAFVLKAETTDYNVYVAKTYDFVLGTTAARVNKQPTLGSLFQSQNSSTWTPDQTRDIMFKLYRAEFDTTGDVYLENGPTPFALLSNNPLRVDSGDSDVTISLQGHGFMKDDKVTVILPSGFADSFGGIVDSAIGGDSDNDATAIKTVTAVDWSGFKIGASSALGGVTTATSTLIGGGNGIIVEKQIMFDEYYPMIEVHRPEGTSIVPTAAFTSGASFAGSGNTYGRNSSSLSGRAKGGYSGISINERNLLESPKVILSPTNETKYLGASTKSASIKLALATTDTKVSPVIDLQRTSLIATENVIDRQDSAATSGFNVPLNFVSETDPSEGSIAAKHITIPLTLQEAAVGLKILLSANRPSEADIDVYYRTGTGDDVLADQPWVEVAATTTIPPDNDRVTFREYEYLAGGDGGSLASFTTYQVKIVMTSTNSSRVPKIKDLRIIALAV